MSVQHVPLEQVNLASNFTQAPKCHFSFVVQCSAGCTSIHRLPFIYRHFRSEAVMSFRASVWLRVLYFSFLPIQHPIQCEASLPKSFSSLALLWKSNIIATQKDIKTNRLSDRPTPPDFPRMASCILGWKGQVDRLLVPPSAS